MNGVQTRFKCKLDVKRCKRFVFPPSSLLPRSNALKTKAIRYFQTDRTLTRIVSPPLTAPRPYRLHLKSGKVSRDLGKELNITGVYGREIEGGAGILLDIPLDHSKELKGLTLETLSNDVVIGIMGITLQ